MVNKITEKDDVVMVPWLVGDEWRKNRQYEMQVYVWAF